MTFKLTLVALALAWISFPVMFAFMARRSKNRDRRRDKSSLVGLAVQIAPYPIMCIWYRPLGSPLVDLPAQYVEALDYVVDAAVVLLALASVVLTITALKALGRHWNLAARIVEGHKLVRTGPYGLVRHPIYTSMLGMNVASALAFARWEVVVITLLLSIVGTWVRVRSEERLMSEAFGEEFRAYAASVPAIIPWFRHRALG